MQHAGFDGMPPLGLTPAAAQPYHNAPSGMSLAPGPKPKAIGKSGAFGATSFGDAAVLGHEDFNRDAFNQETFGPDAFGSDAFGNGKTDAFGLGASDQFGQDRLLGGIDMLGWQHNNVHSDPFAEWRQHPTANSCPMPANRWIRTHGRPAQLLSVCPRTLKTCRWRLLRPRHMMR